MPQAAVQVAPAVLDERNTKKIIIAFYGIYATPLPIDLIISWWLFKVAAGVLFTPLSYLGIYLLRGKQA